MISYDNDGPYLPGHHRIAVDMTTPRQYTARGGWNICCECGAVFAETGDRDFKQRWFAHLTDIDTRTDQ